MNLTPKQRRLVTAGGLLTATGGAVCVSFVGGLAHGLGGFAAGLGIVRVLTPFLARRRQ